MATTNQIAMEANRIRNMDAETNQRNARTQALKQKAEERNYGETARANRAKEQLTRRGQNLNFGSSVISNLSPIKFANDPKWYYMDEQLLNDAARIPFGVALGTPVALGSQTKEVVPGVMRLTWVPAIGSSTDNFRVINTAARNIYAYIRHANAGSKNYEATDLMQYFLVMNSAYVMANHFARLYSICLTAKQENRYYVNVELEAAGGDSSLISNLNDFRGLLNRFLTQLNSFAMPNVFSYLKRQTWLASTIFKDAPIKKSQEYIFVPKGYYLWKPIGAGSTTVCEWHTLYNSSKTTVTLTDVRQVIDNILNSLLTDEDIGIMSGDILKAYTESELVYFKLLPDDFHIESEYSAEVLTQISSANIVPVKEASMDIRQDGLQLYMGSATVKGFEVDLSLFNYQVSPRMADSIKMGEYAFINMDHDNPQPDMVMVASRLITLYNIKSTTSGTVRAEVISCGSEVVTEGVIYTIDVNQPNGFKTVNFNSEYIIDSSKTGQSLLGDYLQFASFALTLSKFDWAPILRVYNTYKDGEQTNLAYVGFMQDIQNYAPISEGVCSALNESALLTEFAVPALGHKIRSNAKTY